MKIRDYNFVLGADPELFVLDPVGPVCPHEFIPGTKDAPHKLKSGNSVQLDGFAAEVGIPPAADEEAFVKHLLQVKEEVKGLLPKDHRLEVLTTAHFTAERIAAAPAKCLELGCDPDYLAYTSMKGADGKKLEPEMPMINPRPNAEGLLFRTGGGHIHIGWTDGPVDPFNEEHIEGCRLLTAAMDVFVGAPSLLLDDDDERRALYGAAGAFRPKPYGMEYRTPSNFWMRDEQTMRWAYRQTICAIKELFTNKRSVKKKALSVARGLINEPGAEPDIIKEVKELLGGEASESWKNLMEVADV